MPRGVRTFKPRRSRITPRERAALETTDELLLAETDGLLPLPWHTKAIVMEIGFGAGEATVEMALADPDVIILAIDVHTPGVGRLVADARTQRLNNVRVMEADALHVLETNVPRTSLAGVRSFFPDPWPKARHHKRRLVQAPVIELVHSRLRPSGFWHVSTDWADYVEWIRERFATFPGFSGGIIERPASRPLTHYERRALREGREVVDLLFVTTGV